MYRVLILLVLLHLHGCSTGPGYYSDVEKKQSTEWEGRNLAYELMAYKVFQLRDDFIKSPQSLEVFSQHKDVNREQFVFYSPLSVDWTSQASYTETDWASGHTTYHLNLKDSMGQVWAREILLVLANTVAIIEHATKWNRETLRSHFNQRWFEYSQKFLQSHQNVEHFLRGLNALKTSIDMNLKQLLVHSSYLSFLKINHGNSEETMDAYFKVSKRGRPELYATLWKQKSKRRLASSVMKGEKNKRAFFRRLQRQLKPLDILLIARPHHELSKHIEGPFQHLGIWLGEHSLLDKYGLSAEMESQIQLYPRLKKVFSDWKNHPVLVHTTLEGVSLGPLDEWVDEAQDIMVLRPKYCREENVVHCLKDHQETVLLRRLLEQMGKPYDFEFARHNQSLVEMELFEQVFWHVSLEKNPKEKRRSFSPTRLAFEGNEEYDVFYPLLYYSQDEVDGGRSPSSMRQKINQKLKRLADQW